MEHSLAQIVAIVKTIGRKPMLELAKNWWIKFAIGVARLST